MTILTEGFSSRLDKVEDKAVVFVQSEAQKEKNEKNKDRLRDIEDTVAWTNIHITGIPEG